MPQMAPSNWLILFLLFNLINLMMISNIYFIYYPHFNKMSPTPKMYNFIYKWMW